MWSMQVFLLDKKKNYVCRYGEAFSKGILFNIDEISLQYHSLLLKQSKGKAVPFSFLPL